MLAKDVCLVVCWILCMLILDDAMDTLIENFCKLVVSYDATFASACLSG